MRTVKESVEQDRYIKTLDIINELNRTHRQGTDDFYNCGDIGIVHIWWGRLGWEWAWIEISNEFLLPKEKVGIK